MNNKVKHEVITWVIFLIAVAILIYPIEKLYVYLQMSTGLLAVMSVVTGMLLMFCVELFVKNILKM
jgi:hypothetical protein